VNGPPVLWVVRGEPTAEEVAALTAVLARTNTTATSRPRPWRGGWADPAHRMRCYPRPEWGGWAASARW
jgi:Acyl-CoA carboxylase epsilon subunit